jgi:hypothetical protein
MSSSVAYSQANSAHVFPPNVKHQVSQLYQNSKQDYSSVYLNLFVSRQQTGKQNNFEV